MARRVARSQAQAFFVDRDCHPQTLAVIRTRAEPLGWRIVTGDPLSELDANAVFGALLQYPGCCGEIRDFRPAIAALHSAGALAVMAADPLALTLITPPGELGADIAVGSTQRFGVPMGYGGPHAAYIATRSAHQRALPGRLVGVSVDSRGRPAYRLALQTREQHIRREKATSNICTAQVLLAIMASMYAVYHGPQGLKKIARRVHQSAAVLAAGLKALGWTVAPRHFFDTITVDVGDRQAQILARAVANGINLRRIVTEDGERRIGMSCDETTTPAVIEAVWRSFGHFAARPAAPDISYATLAQQSSDALPAALAASERVPRPSRLSSASLRDRDAALHAPPCRSRSRARPQHDSAGLLHDEAQCDDGDDPAHLARIVRPASLRAGGSGRRLCGNDRRPLGQALRHHRLRCGLAAAQLRRPGRICGAARHSRLAPQQRAGVTAMCVSFRPPRTAPIQRRRTWPG